MSTIHSSSNGSRHKGAMSANSSKRNGKPNAVTTLRNYISLFSGGMGLDIGLERAGFNCVVANEIDDLAVETIKLNKPALPVISESVENVTLKTLNEAAGFDVAGIDLLAGGPPCQAFSVFGQRRGLHDGRGRMIFEFFRLVDEVRPKAFLMRMSAGSIRCP